MSLSNTQRSQITDLLTEKIRQKLADYSPETQNMPFHVRLLGKDRMALFSFIHSINTMLGSSVFEQVAVIVAAPNFQKVVSQYKGLGDSLSAHAETLIQDIMNGLERGEKHPDKLAEVKKILLVAQKAPFKKIKRPCVDLFLIANDGTEYYFDVKTAKPNLEGFADFKRKILEWVAVRGATGIAAKKIYTGLAIPYNPYAPKPYARWTLQGMLDLPHEIKVAEEFWDFLGGQKTYRELLDVFEQVGIQLRPEIDARFSGFAPN